MQSFALLLLGLAILGACIWFLHRTQLRRTVENADLAAPLEALDDAPLPDFAGTARPAAPHVAENPTAPESIADPDAPSVPDVVVSSMSAVGEAADATPLENSAAPLLERVPAADSTPAPSATPSSASPPTSSDNWLAQIRSLREAGELDAALALSRTQFPKTQAFQQAAIILRQQIREALEKFQPADALLRELYHTAALADLFRTSSSHKAIDPQAALAAVRTRTFQYNALGHLRLKLLNKSDVRALEQLWGAPEAHRHTEDLLGDEWLKWCRNP